ncbi:hypothetical protein [Bacillus amyloliquefaciens]|uniref:hypothetical protein n=2 Tax=Bacillus subtilis group TaxID=653685 RepID=UPI0011CC2F64|nr:hypothetical protein [Bacillus amyloliquefaciens]TXK24374.1 hypothetical protein FVD42_10355 [Bacillus amyloliquefaciens]TXK30590.1 hypothetical protein FVD41_10290 [Bacillus amyloliquefaciens]
MGKGSNYHTKITQREDEYLYDEDGIIRLLSIYNQVEGRTDEATVTMLSDLRTALDTDVLDGIERKVIALHYFLELPDRDVKKLLGIKTSEAREIRMTAPEGVAAVMLGYRAKKLPPYKPFKAKGPDVLGEWLNAVGAGEAPVYSFTREVQNALLRWLGDKAQRDSLACETVRQQEEGPPMFPRDFPDYVERYPFYTETQLEQMDRRLGGLSLVDEGKDNHAAPGWNQVRQGTVTGRKRSVSQDEKNGTFREGWTKLYK